MNGEELAAKIEAECKYIGPSRVEGYAYYRGVNEAVAIVKRELPTETKKQVTKKTKEDD